MKKFLCYDTNDAASGKVNVDSRGILKPNSTVPSTNGSANQQLVTDGAGNVKWDDRLAYETDPVMTEILPETTITFEELKPGFYVFSMDSEVIPSSGAACIVKFNGTEYGCVVKEIYGTIYTGNLGIAGEGEDTGEPFIIIWRENNAFEFITNIGLENTVSISAEISEIYTLNKKFLPFDFVETINNHIEDSNIHLSTNDRNKWNNSIVLSSKRIHMPKYSYESICYGDGKFVAAPFNSDVAVYSTDGINWTQTTLPVVGTWYSIAYGNDKFVAVSDDGKIVYSADGITWTQVNTLSVNNIWRSIIYADNKFVVVGSRDFNNNNNNNNNAAYSTDGINWTLTSTSFSSTCYSITYGDGKFVSVGPSGKAAYSTDGINWTQTTLPIFAYTANNMSVTYGGGMFVVAGYHLDSSANLIESSVAYSTDGINWTKASPPVSGNWAAIAYGADKFVIVGRNGAPIIYSSDGITWHETTNPDISTCSVIYAANKFVAVGDNGSIKWSNDGIAWKNRVNILCTVSGTDVTSQVKESLGLL